MTIQHKNGNILSCKEDIIVHQVNTLGVFGAGLAKQIKNKYPEVFPSYELLCSKHRYCKQKLMGCVDIEPTKDGKYVASIFGQMYVGRDKRYTDYDALRLGLEKVEGNARVFSKSVAIPHGLGSGLAGGDWEIVYGMIVDVFSKGNVEATIYKL